MQMPASFYAAAIAIAVAATVLSPADVLAHDYRVGSISVGHPWTRATPPGPSVGGGYLTLRNEGEKADRLIGASSPVAERVEIHAMEMEDDVMRMRKLEDGLEIPAGATVELAPGGIHIMMIGLQEPIAEGDMVPLTLVFEEAGEIRVELVAERIGANAADAASGSHGDH